MDDEERALRRVVAEQRLEILDALAVATSRRGEVLEAVGRAVDDEDAALAVRDLLGVGEVPARAVMDLQVRRFTAGGREELDVMRAEVRRELEDL